MALKHAIHAIYLYQIIPAMHGDSVNRELSFVQTRGCFTQTDLL